MQVIASKNHRRDTRPSGEGARATEGLLLTWLQRHRLRRLLGASLWITPAACMVGAIAIAPLIRRLDEATRWSLFGFGPAGARALTAAFVSTTFTRTALVLPLPNLKCRLTDAAASRSEEHTSELQSQSNLGCRLLPEKKKIS